VELKRDRKSRLGEKMTTLLRFPAQFPHPDQNPIKARKTRFGKGDPTARTTGKTQGKNSLCSGSLVCSEYICLRI
jgi:hypothetical protein